MVVMPLHFSIAKFLASLAFDLTLSSSLRFIHIPPIFALQPLTLLFTQIQTLNFFSLPIETPQTLFMGSQLSSEPN